MKSSLYIYRFRLGIIAAQAVSIVAFEANAQQPAPAPAPVEAPAEPPEAEEQPAPEIPQPAEPGTEESIPEAAAEPRAPAITETPPPVAVEAAEQSATDADLQAEALADAEAEALAQELSQGGEAEAAVDDYEVDLYGFIDFTYTNGFGNDLVGEDRFAVGNMNVYLSSELGDNWRTLSEVRFSYLPHGTSTVNAQGGFNPRTDTTVPDYTNVQRPVRWGGIILERAWLEYTADPLLSVRMGHFLTPYGIWNVDHGSPVIIGVRQPYIIGDQLLPRSQTGIQVHGMHLVAPVKLGYHLTLSNGRGPIDTHVDLDGNKGLGGRLYAKAETGAGNLALGVSGYKGSYTDRADEWIFTEDSFTRNQPRISFYREQALAADLTWDWGGLAVQMEAILQEIAYDDELRPQAFGGEGPPGVLPDHRRYGAYAQVGYRFDFGGIMPYAGYEYYDDALFFGRTTEAWGGLNIRPTPRVVLKGQYTYAWFHDFELFGNYNALELQAAWSF